VSWANIGKVLTATKVAGKKIVVTIAIAFIALLSFLDSRAILDVVRLKYYSGGLIGEFLGRKR